MTTAKKNKWTLDKTALLTEMFGKFTVAKIAEKLGDVTDSAVTAEINRLGLNKKSADRDCPNAANLESLAGALDDLPKRYRTEYDNMSNSIPSLKEGCQWITENLSSEATPEFCGDKKERNKQYCAKHYLIAYRH